MPPWVATNYYPGYHCNKRGASFPVPKEKLEATVEGVRAKNNLHFPGVHRHAHGGARDGSGSNAAKNSGQDEALIDKRIGELQAQAFATVDKICFEQSYSQKIHGGRAYASRTKKSTS